MASVRKTSEKVIRVKANSYPLVLVHGFMGWGRNEVLGLKYWGGLTDYEQKLTSSGYTTYTATVGPVSSNWDRACELYAYIKGGTVDYGQAHSQREGHSRYGRTYPGLYPEWGNLTTKGKVNKIHLVAHSMGGQTVRALVQLLKEGSKEEQNATPSQLSPLFAGGKSWVHSITTIASTHDGTTLADESNTFGDFAKNFIASVAAFTGAGETLIYDFKLDQWGLNRMPGESLTAYTNRVLESEIWNETNDLANWDLSTDGARVLNSWVKAQPDVYYFSYSACATVPSILTSNELPHVIYMTPLLYPFGTFIGSYTRNEQGRVIIDDSWKPNDGVVNTISQSGPKIWSSDKIVNYNGIPKIGKWNSMPLLDSIDHMDACGIGANALTLSWYKELAEKLAELPINN
ncbi:esterase/lipase family protein [Propionispora hippei]|uniref:triacylglycerol lipase n=1 Tax=Propionispora hippei DSM 15287 TaxID=1123003 RepID=A0A1M6H011_9FIRM|nr:lipase [Propionispora hippei]SHJ15510.1 triacylglycerol lipase [Propionispora hippei DSM 15287]